MSNRVERFKIQEGSDGRWLSTPEVDGKQYYINLNNPRSKNILLELLHKLYGVSPEFNKFVEKGE